MRATRRVFRVAVQMAAWLTAALWGLTPAGARAQSSTPREETWVTDGPVYAIARTPTTVYIGGDFTYVGPSAGHGVPISAITGQRCANLAKVNGSVWACVPNGSGGWYIGGFFTRVGGVARNHVAQILSDGSVDAAWNPNANGAVHILAVSGSSVYAGGEFTAIGGQTRYYIAALDAATGAATDWGPNANRPVEALAVSGSTVYASGEFTRIGGQTRNGIAALDAATGAITDWDPHPDGVWPNVYALAVSDSTVYVAGDFTSIGGQTRRYVAGLDAEMGAATAWDPNANSFVRALAVSGATLYAGGDFTSIGGQTRNRIAALDAATGAATDWDPNASWSVGALAVSDSTVYAGGAFTSIGGQTRNRIAALDAATGLATAWDPSASGDVETLAVSGSTVYAGGDFTSIGGKTRNSIAALDAATGAATDWNPNADGMGRYVFALAVSGSTVYAGGDFTSIGGQTRRYIAALDAVTGAATDWNPNADWSVRALAVSGATVYAGGWFRSVGGQTRNCIAALDGATGAATDWDPSANREVYALAVSGSTIYAGGGFTSIGGQARNYIAALDATTGAAADWNPNANWGVYALAVSGATVYAGGSFSRIGGQTRNYIAALDAATGAAAAWNPNANDAVCALTVSGSTVYAGGGFTSIGGQTRKCIAALDSTTGAAADWNPNPDSVLWALEMRGSTVYAGGDFTCIGGDSRPHLAQFDTPPLLTVWSRNPDSGVTIGVAPLDTNGRGDGTTPFTRGHQPETTVTLTAPAEASGNSFKHWLKDGSLFTTRPTATVITGVDHTMMAVYQEQEIEIRWEDNEHVIADGDTTPSLTAGTDFGSVRVTSGTAVRTFTIANLGTADLALTGSPIVDLSGPDAADFAIVQQPSSPVAPSGSTSFVVAFEPNVGLKGTREATLSIANDDFDENRYDFAIQGTTDAPRLMIVADGVGSAILSWLGSTPDPLQYLGFGWDIYLADWAKTNPADPATMWRPFPPEARCGTLQFGWSGGYHVWISSFYGDGAWFPCANPWTGILYSGTPHRISDVWVKDLGNRKARLHWWPEVYGTWHDQIIVFHVTSVDPPAGEWLAVDGPAGMALWHFIDYGGSAYDLAKANFWYGYADFTLPGPGAYWFYIRGAGWIPPYRPLTTGEFARAFAQISP